ncbi:MFS transporter [Lysobacter ciconiae]|uniref:MFS transporter n=1 Tax=Novilysobacter ciconiae TaxID=2781022 RepID=A0A7S6ZSD3_9GAMM|nr:MFS transporter [Lysobacter ciconiae]
MHRVASSIPPPPDRPQGQSRYAVILFALALGGFAIGTSEFAMMGLMPNLVQAFAVNEPQVGHMISAYALGVVVGAPVLAILGARLPRRTLLLALMAFYALGNLATALAPSYATMLAFRFIAGLPHGAYFGVAMLVAADLAGPERRGTAVSQVMLGLSIAILVGNPLATWMGQAFSWRYTFAMVAAVAVVTALMIGRHLASVPADPEQSPLRELRAFNTSQVWLTLLIGAIGFAGMFCVFSYLTATLTHVTGLGEGWIPIALAVFGAGSVVGNLAGGWLVDRMQFRATAVILIWSALVLAVFPLAAHSLWTILPAVLAIGTMGALGPALQTRLMDVAGEAQTLAAASNHAAFNAANALGPWLGGLAITAGLGWTSTGYVGAATAVAGLLIYLYARRGDHRSGEVMLAERTPQ